MVRAGPTPGLTRLKPRRVTGPSQPAPRPWGSSALPRPTAAFRRAIPGGLRLFDRRRLSDGRGLNDGRGLLGGLTTASPGALTALSWRWGRGLLYDGGQLDVLDGGRQRLLLDGRGGDRRWGLTLLRLAAGLVYALTFAPVIAPVAPTATATAAFASGGAVVV